MEKIKDNELINVTGGKFPVVKKNSSIGVKMSYPLRVVGYGIGSFFGATGMAYSFARGVRDVIYDEWNNIIKYFK